MLVVNANLGDGNQISATFEGIDAIKRFLDSRHFSITKDITLDVLKFKPVDDNTTIVDFASMEAKKESDGLTFYRYQGTFTITLLENLSVGKLEPTNTRKKMEAI